MGADFAHAIHGTSYRWGNPASSGRGTVLDQWLFGPHDERWIPDRHPGAGLLLVFDWCREPPRMRAGAQRARSSARPDLVGRRAMRPAERW